MNLKNITFLLFAGLMAGMYFVFFKNIPDLNALFNLNFPLALYFIIFISVVLTMQGIFTLIWMLYAWEDPENAEKLKAPKKFGEPLASFTILLAARHEEAVISDTIRTIDRMDYPDDLKEILVLCRSDDSGTIKKASETIEAIGKDNIKLVVFEGGIINKPHALNIGLEQATGDVVAVFDAEDEPHRNLLNVINTIMVAERVDVVQAGVQLMNYRSNWFSALNVMEYFLWFKSGLQFFSKYGKVTPLGGNTVFFRKVWLSYVNGWDEYCLTEDADIGIRLSVAGAKTRIVYDEEHATQEETPSTPSDFIKQRTRWNQGFLQIFLKGDWLKLGQTKQKLMALYVLLSPMLQASLIIYMPIGVYIALTQKLPIWATFASFIPLYIFVLQIVTTTVGLFIFTRAYKLKFSLFEPVRLVFAYYPYQFMLITASIRALIRIIFNRNAWEKTMHLNAHRVDLNLSRA